MNKKNSKAVQSLVSKAISDFAKDFLFIFDLKIGDWIKIPETFEEQEESNFPFVNNVRLEADRFNLTGADRVVQITSVELVNHSPHTFVNVTGNFKGHKRHVLVGVIEQE